MSIERIDEELCNGCQLCIEDCPMDVIRFDDAKGKAYLAYPDDCCACFQCEAACPVGAMSVSPLATQELILPY